MPLAPTTSHASGASSTLLYEYVIAGADKASIDTAVDGSYAGTLSVAYSVLEIWVVAQGDDATIDVGIDMTLNNDTGANYDTAVIASVGGAATATASLVAQNSWAMNTHGLVVTTQYPSAHRLTIPGYAGTTFYKTAEYTEARTDATGGFSRVAIRANGYRSTSAISRVKLAARTTQKLTIGSRLEIYAR